MRILALDPGPTETGYCAYDGANVLTSGVFPNDEILNLFKEKHNLFKDDRYLLAIEMIASYGMPVGREVFETCVWVGRYQQAWHAPGKVLLVYRKEVKMHLCGSPRAKDGNIRQALLDLFPRSGGGKTPQIGTKAQPGPLYGMATHAWAALGVAVTCAHNLKDA
jgi:hypothetical protein